MKQSVEHVIFAVKFLAKSTAHPDQKFQIEQDLQGTSLNHMKSKQLFF